ncbi:carboxylate-amine ligase [Actinoplanes subglobosus]|uniref:Putative glutamate--cysteine ligase 2 n=1 Tax=Actinoplanes subglobosus TaxID=1547892 RepID=A0ABV8J9Z2_9ACTN
MSTSSTGPVVRTFGVEEEFLLLDPRTAVNLPLAAEVAGRLPPPLRDRSRPEFRPSMMEMVTDVCTSTEELSQQLRAGRGAAAEAARQAGAALIAVGATPVAEADPQTAAATDLRFRAITDHYGPIARDPALCGCHVHVGVADPDLAVEICTRLRADLPLLQALTANSPLSLGTDTGYASWRCVQLRRWPTVGPWPHLRSTTEFERTVAALVASGDMMDDSMVLWWARPSRSFPTVEIRAADVCPDPDDTVLLAALVRALVDTAAHTPAPAVPDVLVNAAHGSAARYGMSGTLLDAHTGRARPAWDLVGALVDRITPALRRHHDVETVTAGLHRIHRDGTGAERQRRLLAEGLSIPRTLARVSGTQ